MGATIYWKPVSNDGMLVDVGLRSAFVEAMTKAFGPYPWRLSYAQVETLRGMAAAAENDAQAYKDLIDRIGECHIIEVWPEY
jgi:hypothetical protein